MANDFESFDLSGDEFLHLGQETLRVMLDAIGREQDGPVYVKPTGHEVSALFDEPLPQEGIGAAGVIDRWREQVLPYCRRNGHPRFFGYVCTSADPVGMFADAAASAMNQPVTAWRSSPASTTVERQVLKWLCELTGFSSDGWGAMTSGGSMANFQALACAVHRAEQEVRLPSGSRHQMAIYVSTEAHVSLRKAARILGLPDEQIRIIGVDRDRRLNVEELKTRITTDQDLGIVPVAVCGSAGTANTGAIDPLDELATFCHAASIWFHVDGSYGAPAVLTDDYKWMSRAFSIADSLALDPHKWLFAPVDAGSVLIRDDNILRSTFSLDSEYTTVTETDPTERFAYFDRGLEMSRRFRALKVWSILQARGVMTIRDVIKRNIDLRQHLDRLVKDHERLQLLGSELSISCFRFVPPGDASDDAVDRINESIIRTIIDDGHFYMSPTVLDGRFSLRVCIVNFRTRKEDIEGLIGEVIRLGESL